MKVSYGCYLCPEAYSAADGPEGDHPLNTVGVAAAVGLEARVVSLLQDELLAAEAGVLVAHPTASRERINKVRDMEGGIIKQPCLCCFGYVRATLDLQGADVLHPTLHDVLAAGGELHSPALEVLLIVHSDL